MRSGQKTESEVACRVTGLVKRYAGHTVLDLDAVEFRGGQVHAIIGHNGAGKSTLVKVLAGAIAPDEGQIAVNGVDVNFANPTEARLAGIVAVHQDSLMIPGFTAADNILLGLPYPKWGPFIRRSKALEYVEAAGLRLGLDRELLSRPTAELSIADQQLVSICRALTLNAVLLILDEPTAPLTSREVDRLFGVIDQLVDQGHAIAYISHRLEELSRVADCVTVLRDGKRVGNLPASTSRRSLVEMMTGEPAPDVLRSGGSSACGTRLLEARGLNLTAGADSVSLEVCSGEVVGIAGLVGSGRTRLGRMLCGLASHHVGQVQIEGHQLKPGNARDAVAAGVVFVPEDRRRHGLVMNQSIRFNVALGNFRSYTRAGLLSRRRVDRAIAGQLSRLNARYRELTQPVGELSGGNQQKVLLARWMLRGARVFVLDEPTAGLDITAQGDVHATVRHLAQAGAGVLYISSDFDEMLAVVDRVLVMRDHSIVAHLEGKNLTKDTLLLHAFALGNE